MRLHIHTQRTQSRECDELIHVCSREEITRSYLSELRDGTIDGEMLDIGEVEDESAVVCVCCCFGSGGIGVEEM